MAKESYLVIPPSIALRARAVPTSSALESLPAEILHCIFHLTKILSRISLARRNTNIMTSMGTAGHLKFDEDYVSTLELNAIVASLPFQICPPQLTSSRDDTFPLEVSATSLVLLRCGYCAPPPVLCGAFMCHLRDEIQDGGGLVTSGVVPLLAEGLTLEYEEYNRRLACAGFLTLKVPGLASLGIITTTSAAGQQQPPDDPAVQRGVSPASYDNSREGLVGKGDESGAVGGRDLCVRGCSRRGTCLQYSFRDTEERDRLRHLSG